MRVARRISARSKLRVYKSINHALATWEHGEIYFDNSGLLCVPTHEVPPMVRPKNRTAHSRVRARGTYRNPDAMHLFRRAAERILRSHLGGTRIMSTPFKFEKTHENVLFGPDEKEQTKRRAPRDTRIRRSHGGLGLSLATLARESTVQGSLLLEAYPADGTSHRTVTIFTVRNRSFWPRSRKRGRR